MTSLRIVYVVAVVSMLFLAQATPAHTLFGQWPDLTMTYRLDDTCVGTPMESAIRIATDEWRMWLPEANWTEVAEGERVTHICDWRPATGVICYGSEPFTYCKIVYVNYTEQHATEILMVNIVAHEMGHTFGIVDYQSTGGLMAGPSHTWSGENENLLLPTVEDVNQVRVGYGLAPATSVPEFTVPFLFLIALFTFWTPIMRKKMKT